MLERKFEMKTWKKVLKRRLDYELFFFHVQTRSVHSKEGL